MSNGVYWIGQDGNYYVKNSSGVQNMGSTLAPLSPQYIAGLQQIDDPVNPTGTSSIATTAPSGSASAPAPKVLNQGAVSNTQATIDQIPGLLEAALAAEAQRYQNSISGFGAQEQAQRGTYDQSTTTNQLNYDSNFMDSIRAGVKGLGGLFNVLRGTGAAGGSVEGDVRDVVGEVTSKDIRGGADTRNENQQALDASLSTFLTDLGLKRRQNEDVRVNNERAIRRDSATQLQDLYGKMAGFYGDADRTGEANEWLARAGGLTPEIATNSRTQVSNYDSTPVAVKAPELSAFAAPSQPNAIAAPSNGQVGSGIFSISDRRRERTPAVAGV
jgi:hypothetical protein